MMEEIFFNAFLDETQKIGGISSRILDLIRRLKKNPSMALFNRLEREIRNLPFGKMKDFWLKKLKGLRARLRI